MVPNDKSKYERGYAFTRSDLLLSSSEWSTLIVGIISKHLCLESTNPDIRRNAEEMLQKELNFASHLGKIKKFKKIIEKKSSKKSSKKISKKKFLKNIKKNVFKKYRKIV
jgi:hypothetical protein